MQAEHYNGLIAVWKEQGYTSHDVVAKLRGILHQKKIGHTGTLDPQAKGVLAVGLGLGTKTFDLLPDHWKTYEAEVTFGVQTDTEDIWGNVLRHMMFQKHRKRLYRQFVPLGELMIRYRLCIQQRKLMEKNCTSLQEKEKLLSERQYQSR